MTNLFYASFLSFLNYRKPKKIFWNFLILVIGLKQLIFTLWKFKKVVIFKSRIRILIKIDKISWFHPEFNYYSNYKNIYKRRRHLVAILKYIKWNWLFQPNSIFVCLKKMYPHYEISAQKPFLYFLLSL